jgi:hypothetical protein
MKRLTPWVVAVVFILTATGVAFSDEGGRKFREFLNGFKEAPAIVSTAGNGTFSAEISKDGDEIHYKLSFRDLESDVRQAHIHIGHPQNSGNIVLWLCDSAQNPAPLGTDPPPCAGTAENDVNDVRDGEVEGILTEADVRNNPANGIAGPTATTPGEFDEVVRLIRAGLTYVNVHTANIGAGEIRSQINNRNNGDHSGHR